jgi:hypothetical protein
MATGWSVARGATGIVLPNLLRTLLIVRVKQQSSAPNGAVGSDKQVFLHIIIFPAIYPTVSQLQWFPARRTPRAMSQTFVLPKMSPNFSR